MKTAFFIAFGQAAIDLLNRWVGYAPLADARPVKYAKSRKALARRIQIGSFFQRRITP